MVAKELISKRILHAWDLDARLSYSAISRKIGPSRDVVQKIISDYEKNDTIKGYITVLDIGKLGYIGVAGICKI
jgi:DNA-binding Lrp family transcriptional regulator